MSDSKHTTDFGYEQVPTEEKAGRVRAVFDSVAENYDVMNDLMSMGLHRLWKRYAVELSGVRRGQSVLDLAAGTGDLSARFSGMVGAEGRVVMSDINPKMLSRGRARLLDGGKAGNLHYVIADAERLPFTDNTFDCISIGFGLRNVTDKARALGSMFHALKPGGRVVILEFSHPHAKALRAAYDLYSFRVLPLMGRLVAKDPDSYRYLAESIRMHPDQEALKNLMEEAGFERCDFHDLSGGIVAVHRGYKF